MSKEIDHEDTREAVCPHCGHQMRDTWELHLGDEDSAEVECGDCEKPYRVIAFVRRTYDTVKIEPKGTP